MSSAAYPLLEFQQVTIAVANLAQAAMDWSEKLNWPPAHTRDDRVEFHLDGSVLRLQPVDDDVPPGVGRVDVGVADLPGLGAHLRRSGAAIEVADDRVVLDRAAVNGVQLVLHRVRSDNRPRASSSWRRINHLVVAVRDDEQAKHGWAELFGNWPAQQTDTGEVAHHVPVGWSWFGLTSAGSDAGPLEKFVERRGEGVYAVGLVVDERVAVISDLTTRGAELIVAGPQIFLHPRTTHGVLVDIVEPNSVAGG